MVLQAVVDDDFDGEVVGRFLPIPGSLVAVEVEVKAQFPELAAVGQAGTACS